MNLHVLRSCFCEDCLFLPFLFIVTFSYKISNYNITRNSTPYYWKKTVKIKVYCQRRQFKRKILVFSKMTISLHTLPVEMIYRIFDNFNNKTILLSCYNVCTRLNQILDTYQRYQVIFGFTILFLVEKSLTNINCLLACLSVRRGSKKHKGWPKGNRGRGTRIWC